MSLGKKIAGWVCLSYIFLGALPAGPDGVQGSVAEAVEYDSGEQTLSSYWVSRCRDAEQVLLRPEHVRFVNGEIRKKSQGRMAEFSSYPEIIAAAGIHDKIRTAMRDYVGWELPELYQDGTEVSWEEWKAVKDNCGIEIPIRGRKTLYGVTTDPTEIRLLPVAERWYESPYETGADLMQEGVLAPGEPVAVLMESVDKNFLFVQGRNLMGWAAADTIGLTTRESWMRYAELSSCLVVTAKERRVTVDGKVLVFPMGSHLPIVRESMEEGITVLLPVMENGMLGERELHLQPDNTVHMGPLPYSRKTLIDQAFRYLGEAYSPDGISGGVTDEAMMARVYRSAGIELPGNRVDQEQVMPTVTDLTGMDEGERYGAFFDAKPGSLVFRPGRVMMYLGLDGEGIPMVIQAKSNGVAVTDFYDDGGWRDYTGLLTSIGTIP